MPVESVKNFIPLGKTGVKRFLRVKKNMQKYPQVPIITYVPAEQVLYFNPAEYSERVYLF